MREHEKPDVYAWVRYGGGRHSFLGFSLIVVLCIFAYVALGGGESGKDGESEKDLSKAAKSTMPALDKNQIALAVSVKKPPAPVNMTSTDGMIPVDQKPPPTPEWVARKKSGAMIIQTNAGGEAPPAQKPVSDVIEKRPISEGSFSSNLATEKRKGVTASKIGDRNFIIAQGVALDCILETALDTSLPGMATCILSRDVYSDNGKVVLLDRGSQLIGEYTNSVKQGQSRVFVVWTRAKTPEGVIINLDSPGADALGIAGLDGWVDNHFMERFGAAILMSFIQDTAMVLTSAESSRGAGSTTIFGGFGNMGTGASNVASNILNYTANIPPNVIKSQGDSIRVMVARDLDFSTVYSLQKVNQGGG